MRPATFTWIVAAVAIGWRIIGITDWPSPAYLTLQYESAIAARAAAIDLCPNSASDSAREWRRAIGTEPYVSPPLLPGLVAIVDAEQPWTSRLFTIAFWVLAGFAIRRIIHRITGSEWAAATGFAWFVLNPFGMILSRSFQTESLLVLAFALGLDLLSQPFEKLSWQRTLLLGMACGAIAFAKPGAVFLPLICGFIATILPRRIPGTFLAKAAHIILFSILVAGPGSLYAMALLRPHGGRIMPSLLGEAWYWQGLWWNVASVIGPAVIGVGLVGIALAIRSGSYLLTGLVVGHLATMAVFTYHAATHDYYQAPLMVVASVALGPPIAAVERWHVARRGSTSRLAKSGLLFAMLLGFATWLHVERNPAVGPYRWMPENRAALERDAEVRARQAAQAEAVRPFIDPGETVIELTEGYGYPLRYYGRVQTTRWPGVEEREYMALAGATSQAFSTEEYLHQLVRDLSSRHFVVTDWNEWRRQPELQAALAGWNRIEPHEGVAIFVRPNSGR